MLMFGKKEYIPTISDDHITFQDSWTGEFVKIRLNDKEVIVPRSSLLRAAHSMGTYEEQEEMMPMKTIEVKQLHKNVTIKLTKTAKKGTEITIPVTFDIPLAEGESVKIIEKKLNLINGTGYDTNTKDQDKDKSKGKRSKASSRKKGSKK